MPPGSGTPLAGRYLLLEQLAAGTRAAVWRGVDDVLGRPVAVKLYLDAVTDPAARTFIHARARAAARLNHPHTTAVYDSGDLSGPDGGLTPYVVMELLDGEPLADRLARPSTVPWPLAVRIAAEIGAALAVAHGRGVVHGRVGVPAVMLTPSGAKLLGLAGPGQAPPVAPQPADDVLGLGRLLLQSLCGPGTDATAERVPQLLERIAGLPDDIPPACAGCLAAQPQDRPAMADLARRLASVVNRHAASEDGTALLVPVGDAFSPARRRRARAHTVLGAAGVVGMLALSGTAAWYGDDLLTATLRPDPAPVATPSSGGGAGTSSAATGRTDGPGGPGTTSGGAGAPPTSASTQGPYPHSSTAPEPPAPAEGTPSAPALSALQRLRASVDNGRAAGDIAPALAAELDTAIDDIARRAEEGRNVSGKVTALRLVIDRAARDGGLTPSRAAELHEALDAYPTTVSLQSG